MPQMSALSLLIQPLAATLAPAVVPAPVPLLTADGAAGWTLAGPESLPPAANRLVRPGGNAAGLSVRDRLPALPPLGAGSAAGLDLAALSRQTLGAAQRIALSWEQSLAGDATVRNRLGLRHASDRFQARFTLQSQVSLIQGGPVTLAYDSAAHLKLVRQLAVGAVARGSLGTLAAPQVRATGQFIGPDVRLALAELGGKLAAETTWRLPLGTDALGRPVQPAEFRWNLSFRRQL